MRDLNDKLQPSKMQAGSRCGSVLLYLCWRLGWECGAVQYALGQNNISWGTYSDAMGTHCNAHANNMVVRSFSSTNLSMEEDDFRFLAPLDFDMSFTKETFVMEATSGKDSFAVCSSTVFLLPG